MRAIILDASIPTAYLMDRGHTHGTRLNWMANGTYVMQHGPPDQSVSQYSNHIALALSLIYCRIKQIDYIVKKTEIMFISI